VRRSVGGARLLAAVARGGAYCFGGGGDGSRTGSGLIFGKDRLQGSDVLRHEVAVAVNAVV